MTNDVNYRVSEVMMMGVDESTNEMRMIRCDASGHLAVGLAASSSFSTGKKTVAAHGTAEQLPSVALTGGQMAYISAPTGNTGNVWIGSSKANAEAHTVAYLLTAGESTIAHVTNLNLIWVDSAVNTEGIKYLVS